VAAWRWHFYAGLYVAPFLIMLAVTGLIMLWSSVLVGRDGEKIFAVTPSGQAVPVSVQADAAAATVPGGTLVQYIVPRTGEQPAVFPHQRWRHVDNGRCRPLFRRRVGVMGSPGCAL
jgi:uncharacterized iron-regulated membrane protein